MPVGTILAPYRWIPATGTGTGSGTGTDRPIP